jgi:hypothetical protein
VESDAEPGIAACPGFISLIKTPELFINTENAMEYQPTRFYVSFVISGNSIKLYDFCSEGAPLPSFCSFKKNELMDGSGTRSEQADGL